MKTFEIGKIYGTRSLCDYNCIFTFEVVSRTEKTVKLRAKGEKEIFSKRIKRTEDGLEWVYPNGQYSMAPSLSANELLEAVA